MGMGNYADGADTIELEFVKEICPEELDNFQVALDEEDDFDHFCCLKQYDEYPDGLVEDLYAILQNKFEQITGLQLSVAYHEAEDRGDGLDGGTFTVDGVYMRTPAGEKYKDKIVKKTWTNFG